jgi:AcrR family transcriptional regulator
VARERRESATGATGAKGAPETQTRLKRRPFRREQILAIAIHLFYKQGYQATGMDDIGRIAGMTGPAIYRHFKNKEDILLAAIERGSDQILGKVREIVEHSTTPDETLRGLINNFVVAMLNKPELAGLMLKEGRRFPVSVRTRWDLAHRLHMEEWAHALAQARPDLSDGQVRLMINATAGLLSSAVSYHSGLERQRLERLLNDMAYVALLGENPAEPQSVDVRAVKQVVAHR